MTPWSRWIVLICKGKPERKFFSKEGINGGIFLGYKESSYLTEIKNWGRALNAVIPI